MTDLKEKVQKLHESRLKAQTELNTLQQKISESITKADRRVKVERLVKEAEVAKTKAFNKNERIFSLASKTSNAETLKADLEKWLKEVKEQNDENLRQARDYIDACPATDEKSHSSVGTVNEKGFEIIFDINEIENIKSETEKTCFSNATWGRTGETE